jgi:hypothetical protein
MRYASWLLRRGERVTKVSQVKGKSREDWQETAAYHAGLLWTLSAGRWVDYAMRTQSSANHHGLPQTPRIDFPS